MTSAAQAPVPARQVPSCQAATDGRAPQASATDQSHCDRAKFQGSDQLERDAHSDRSTPRHNGVPDARSAPAAFLDSLALKRKARTRNNTNTMAGPPQCADGRLALDGGQADEPDAGGGPSDGCAEGRDALSRKAGGPAAGWTAP